MLKSIKTHKMATVTVKVNPLMKAQAEKILRIMDLTMSQVMRKMMTESAAGRAVSFEYTPAKRHRSGDWVKKTTSISFKIDTLTYQKATEVLNQYGTTVSAMVQSLIHQMVYSNHFPLGFPVSDFQQAILDAETGHLKSIGDTRTADDVIKWAHSL